MLAVASRVGITLVKVMIRFDHYTRCVKRSHSFTRRDRVHSSISVITLFTGDSRPGRILMHLSSIKRPRSYKRISVFIQPS